MSVFESARRWVKSRPRLRRALEPVWILVLLGYQRALNLALRLRSSRAYAALRLCGGYLKLKYPGPAPVEPSRGETARARLVGPWARIRRASARARRASLNALATLRQKIIVFAILNERRAINWAYGSPAWSQLPIRIAGRVALRMANIYYRRAFERLGQFAKAPLLSRDKFDPNHVMHIVGSLGPGGAERQVVTTLLGLRKTTKFRLTLVCIFLEQEWQRFFLDEVREAGIEVVQMGRDTSAPLELDVRVRERFDEAFSYTPINLADVRHYAAEILRRRPGVLHTWMDETNCKGGLAAIVVGVPRVVLSARSVAPYHFAFYHQYLVEAYRTVLGSDRFVLLNNSRAGALDYASWLGVDVRRIPVIHNGYHFEDLPPSEVRAALRVRFRSECGWTDDVRVLGTIIRFTEEKRPDLWVDAAARLARQRPDFRFLLVGDGPMRTDLIDRVSRDGLADRFVFAGYRRDTMAALCAMDAFLLTSRKEGLPNVLIEAQALGVPVIAPDVGGAAEAFIPGESGVLLDQVDAVSIGKAVLDLLDDSLRLGRFSERAQQQVRQRFSISRMLAATIAVYGKAMGFEQ